MKTLKIFSYLQVLLLALMALSLTISARAEKMSTETQDLVIQKMERLLSILDKKDSSYRPSQQRLADLLAERARTRFMLEIEAGCEGCKGSTQDRKRATGLYEELLKTQELQKDGRIFFQLAHLYQMAGQTEKAVQLLETALEPQTQKSLSQNLLSRSRVALADLYFQKGLFDKAHKLYTLSLKDPQLSDRSLVVYNKAWCEFNLDQLPRAISTLAQLLSQPSQIVRNKEDGTYYDKSFHADILKDLATFYTRRPVSSADIHQFDQLIPKDNRKNQLLSFATELDRVGQKRPARDVLKLYLSEKNLTDEERIQAYVLQAQVTYDAGKPHESTAALNQAVELSKKNGCGDEIQCQKLQSSMKRYVTELHRAKKLEPDQTILKNYEIYLSLFPQDREMQVRAAQIAMTVGNWSLAIQFYRNISTGRGFSEQEKEEALLNEVAAAEKSENSLLKRESYIFFIKKTENEEQSFKVRYQLAYLDYQEKKWKEAATSFHSLASNKKGLAELRKKAADLAIDSYAQLKDHDSLEEKAYEYAALFPAFRKDFETLARKALMNQVALVSNNPESGQSTLSSFLKRIENMPLASASFQEKELAFSNAIILAQQTHNDEAYLKHQKSLLSLQGLSESKRQSIYSRLSAFYERQLDFKNAYIWARKINSSRVSPAEKEFRLGTLADLAQMQASGHYEKSLKLGMKDSRQYIIRARLVQLSPYPVSELKKHSSQLLKKQQLWVDLCLLTYAKTSDPRALQLLGRSKSEKARSALRFLSSQTLLSKIDSLKIQISQSRLKSYSAQDLKSGTRARLKLLKRADQLLRESVQLKNLVAQMMLLEIMAEENLRLAEELKRSPTPQGLTPQQLAQYERLLIAQLSPFFKKSEVSRNQINAIWSRSSELVQLINEYSQSRPEIQKLMSHALKRLSQVSGSGPLKSNLLAELSNSPYSLKDLKEARNSVSENPQDRSEIEKLKKIETKIGHPLMPDYLEARLNHLEKEKSL